MGEQMQQGDTVVTVFVCTNCRDAEDSSLRPGVPLIAALRDAIDNPAIAVRPVSCLANCENRLGASFVHRNGWSYVFGGLSAENTADIATGATMLADSENGFLPLRGRPQCLRKGLAARIPPFHHQEDIP